MKGPKLVLHMGYSHPVEMDALQGISYLVDAKAGKISVEGVDKGFGRSDCSPDPQGATARVLPRQGEFAMRAKLCAASRARPANRRVGRWFLLLWAGFPASQAGSGLVAILRDKVMAKDSRSVAQETTRACTPPRHGTAERPRLNVFRSLSHIYAQVIDDDKGTTLVVARRWTARSAARQRASTRQSRPSWSVLW